MPLNAAERKQKQIENAKKSGKYGDYLKRKKEAIRKRQKLELVKLPDEVREGIIEGKRKYERERKKAYRLKVKNESTSNEKESYENQGRHMGTNMELPTFSDFEDDNVNNDMEETMRDIKDFIPKIKKLTKL